jgi:hypothetical protein
VIETVREVVGSARFSQALTESIMGFALITGAVRSLIGWPGALAVLAFLVVLAVVSLWAQPERIEWRGALPLSLLALFGLLTVSVIWSQYTWVTVGGITYALGFGVLGLYIALVRDLLQLVRAVGNALRVILTASFALEILSGLLLDTPIVFLGISGSLAEGGPIEGLSGTRNAFAFLGALAVLSFWIELRTKSVSRTISFYSLSIAGATILFARSPVSLLVLAAVLVAGLALVILRRQQRAARRATQSVLLISVGVFGLLAWFFRTELVNAVDAATDVKVRTSVWSSVRGFIDQNPVQGWGWAGPWQTDIYPFAAMTDEVGRQPPSALNAYVDIWLQLGLAGLLVLIAALGLAFARAWLVASERRSTVCVWPALTLVLLVTTSTTESYLLYEGGLLLFVTSAFSAARNRSWRGRLD